MKMWHGGAEWLGGPEVKAPKKGRYECGPGIYLTDTYLTAQKYAKGGLVTTLVELTDDIQWLESSHVPIEDARNFILEVPRLKNRAKLLEEFDIACSRRRLTTEDSGSQVPRVPANILVNLGVNNEVLSGNVGLALVTWLTGQGIQASRHRAYGDETWVVVFDPRIIKSYKTVKARDVRLEDYKLNQ